MDSHSAREWRSLRDTTVSAQLLYYQSRAWAARLRRQDDFYQESALLWLEADTLIRRESKGRKSLDDFCKLFYGAAEHGSPSDTVRFRRSWSSALNAVQAYDWAGFWRERLEPLAARRTVGGIAGGGLVVGSHREPIHHAPRA